jgi:anti-sigma regulatory factor (Ser/Thr protein kinase)
MGSILTSSATDAMEPIRVGDEADVSLVREAVRARASEVGLDRERAESLVTAASELGHNQIAHTAGGEMLVRTVGRLGVPGVEVLARDQGGGISEPTAALRGERPAGKAGSRGLGVGLSAAHRLADELDFDVRLGHGTTIAARKFKTPLPRSEVAVLARPCRGESVIGDDAAFGRRGDGLLLAVADGLGHGPLAQEAAALAVATLRGSSSVSPRELLQLCHNALTNTRGAVMSVVYVPDDGGEVVQAGAGNIACHLYRNRTSVRFPSTPGVLGQARPGERISENRSPLGGRHVLVLYSDGLSSRMDLTDEAALLREPPLIIAHRLLAEHGRDHDDALVLVATGSSPGPGTG